MVEATAPAPEPTPDPREARRTFGTVMLAGIGTAGLTAIAASRTWLHANGDAAGFKVSQPISGSDAAPLALALALVALAAWGVVLVARLRTRRVAIVLGLLAALGVLATVIDLGPHAHAVAARELSTRGAGSVASLSHAGWYWLCGIGAVAQVAALLGAFRLAPGWPEMSSRYDAPVAGAAAGAVQAPAEELADLELWKALDEGRDPTGPTAP
ncbi:MAG: hypothetical protein JWP74_604 [Marmoricola sp.]|nr:hypothetical protein [Marmoricola sp.]